MWMCWDGEGVGDGLGWGVQTRERALYIPKIKQHQQNYSKKLKLRKILCEF
jgi:hypothetical protein